jgi:hypothetical protein
VQVPPVLRSGWVTDTVAVPPEVNKDPGSCAPSASWAAVHWPPAAAAGVVAGCEVAEGGAAARLALAVPAAGWLGVPVAVTAEAADVPAVTDGSSGLP